MRIICYLVAILLGCGLTLQGAINTNLKQHVGSPITAATISFGTGALVLLLAYFVIPNQQHITLDNMKTTAWWMWMGGFIGASYILFSIMVIPAIGFANFFILLVAGQILLSAVFDQWGLWGHQVRALDLPRAMGIVLMAAGIYFVQK